LLGLGLALLAAFSAVLTIAVRFVAIALVALATRRVLCGAHDGTDFSPEHRIFVNKRVSS
jgi:hypothetical protein